jgi:hypothetical protein
MTNFLNWTYQYKYLVEITNYQMTNSDYYYQIKDYLNLDKFVDKGKWN